jgi:hypothetical protein
VKHALLGNNIDKVFPGMKIIKHLGCWGLCILTYADPLMHIHILTVDNFKHSLMISFDAAS